MKRFLAIAAVAACGSAAWASAFVIDGVRDAKYGSSIVLQNTPTGFGNSDLGMADWANGSELNGAYGMIANGNLHLFFTGNLETNYNKLEIFIDSVAGGQNVLRGDNADVDFNGLNRMAGLTFDSAFSPDYYLTATNGDSGGYQIFANFAELLTNGGGAGGFIGGSGAGNRVLVGSNGVFIGVDNSNVDGVDGGSVGDPASVMTGIEVMIPLSLLGNPAGPISVAAFINGGGHDFLSNQVLGGVGGAGNLGEPSLVNFNDIDGDQFFTIVPEPVSLMLLALGGLMLRRR
jgi:hypothetical protein